MRKLLILLIALLTIFALVSCKGEPEPAHEHNYDTGTDNGNGKIVYKCIGCDDTYSVYKTYTVGDTGPAGGLIFYDCDADNETGNADGLVSSECGWRYLETTSADLESPYHCFGYYRESDDGTNQTVGTNREIGTGKSNTEALVAAMGDNAYSSASGSAKTSDYAAKICDDYSAGGKDDWFLPSRDELSLMYDNLCQAGLGGFDWGYISSSELNEFLILDVNFHSGEKTDSSRNNTPKVRPVRAF